MQKFIYGKKIGMSQIMDEEGLVTSVTLIKALPMTVITTLNNNNVESVLVGSQEVEEKKLNKPKVGLFKKHKTKSFKRIKECRYDEATELKSNDIIDVSIFDENEKVNVRGKSKGCGFAGTVKRHNFSRGPMTHGSKNHRLPGSIGGGTDPGRVFKGTKMGGQMGDKNVSIMNLKIVKIDSDNGIIFIKGSVPGKKDNILEIYN